ncbi:hypothetical protein [Staphylococcus aureus]|uniref:hypothetical protein n=1 Tax=Staphylococcus aureus TaxID=1280 RepID=UPI000BA74A48|nr:hypothetical protein [Staphylococcus aureus]
MEDQNKKVIYYYHAEAGHRPLFSIGASHLCVVYAINSIFCFYTILIPDLDNLFVQIDGVEFKVL